MRIKIENVINGWLVTYQPTEHLMTQRRTDKTIFTDAPSMLEYVTRLTAPPEPWPEGAKWKTIQVTPEGITAATFLDSAGCCLRCGKKLTGYDVHKCKTGDEGK